MESNKGKYDAGKRIAAPGGKRRGEGRLTHSRGEEGRLSRPSMEFGFVRGKR